MPPWEKYQSQGGDGPWTKYSAAPAEEPAKPPSVAADVAKSVGAGVSEAPIDALGLPGSVQGMMRAGGEWVGNKLFGDLKPEEKERIDKAMSGSKIPSAGDIKGKVEGVTGEFYKPQTTAGKYAKPIAETLANPLSYLGPGGLAVKAGGAAASAVGSEALGQVAEGTALETPARILGGVAGGAAAGTVAAERGLAKLAAELPTPQKIKESAKAAYDYLKTSNTRISSAGTAELFAETKAALNADNFHELTAPTTYKLLETELGKGGEATVGNLDSVRQKLGKVPIANETDREAANRAIRAIDDWLMNVPNHHVLSGNPATDAAILKHAQGQWAAHKKLEMLEEGSTSAQRRAGASGSGANRINTARQEVRKILDSDKKSRGLSKEAKAKMEEIVLGTWATNAARTASKVAPTGAVSGMAGLLTASVAGPGAGAAVGIAGYLAKYLGEYLTDRQMGQLEQLIRAESPIGKPIAAKNAPKAQELGLLPGAAALRGGATPLAAGQ